MFLFKSGIVLLVWVVLKVFLVVGLEGGEVVKIYLEFWVGAFGTVEFVVLEGGEVVLVLLV